MSAKAIREHDGKKMIGRLLGSYAPPSVKLNHLEQRCVQITDARLSEEGDAFWAELLAAEPWLETSKLVVKPDQLIKRRGKAGLLGINKTFDEAKAWILERTGKEQQVEKVAGILDTFIIEPFVPHAQEDEYYICIQSHRDCDELLFTHEGGVDIGDVDAKATRLRIDLDEVATPESMTEALLGDVPAARKEQLAGFLCALLALFRDLNYVYLEINPLVVMDDTIAVLDLAAKIDETAAFLCHSKWGPLEFPAAFGRAAFPEEKFIADMDAKTGASLKLTILNDAGRIWTMVAGGGASVVYADTVADLGQGAELANYGEYSGAPDETQTYAYAKTVLSLMTRTVDPRGKVLIIGGGIANFTDVAATFKGIIRALTDFQEPLREGKITVWVRRGGPNYQEGLTKMSDLGRQIRVPIKVYGPETHIVAVVPLALGIASEEEHPQFAPEAGVMRRSSSVGSNMVAAGATSDAAAPDAATAAAGAAASSEAAAEAPAAAPSAAILEAAEVSASIVNATQETTCLVYGLQHRAVQGMLDFDHMCGRSRPSVEALVYPFSSNHVLKFYWGSSEVLVPVYQQLDEAVARCPNASVLVNFASFRSVYDSVMDALRHSEQLRTIAIIAEGVPESQTRRLVKACRAKGVGVIGPATVGGIKPGCFRIGNTGGMLDNIVMSRLYRPGSVAYVSKSGGMSNELNNLICRNSDGVCEGVAIGGDRYPGSRFLDHLIRYNDNPEVKMLVLLGEVGGTDEYEVCEAIRSGRITKPLVAWCIGTCASIFPYEVQFGHAGACARANLETAAAKNAALKEAGAHVPSSFAYIGEEISSVFASLVASGRLVRREEPPVPQVPMDYKWAQRLGLVRRPANFISTISDDRGEELTYAGVPISQVCSDDLGVGGALSLLWFRRRLPPYATKFIEMVLMVTADHGPAVSGAHNTIVTARAGKDLISALCSGLLTIGPRFGGALDEAASVFSEGADAGESAADFVRRMRKSNRLIMGIGHKIKSIDNPDMRVKIIKEYAIANFKETQVLDFALAVEQVTTRKKANLILNVDGCIAACFVDMLRSCGEFTLEEANEAMALGCLNGLFVLGRSIGFMGHFLDQKRLKQGLYRHDTSDILYTR